MSGDLRAYVLAAERGGPAGIFEEAACNGLDARQLGYLAQHLREHNETEWRLTILQRRDLIDRLLAACVADRRIREMADCSQDTVARRRAAPHRKAKSPPAIPHSRDAKVRKITVRDLRAALASFDATSGANQEAEMALREALGRAA